MLVATIGKFIGDETGATAIEYGLLGAMIALAIITSFSLLGNSLQSLLGVGAGSAAEVMNAQLNKLP